MDGSPLLLHGYLRWLSQHALLLCMAQLWGWPRLDPEYIDVAQGLSGRVAAELAVVFVGSMVLVLGLDVPEDQSYVAVSDHAASFRLPLTGDDEKI